MNDEGIKRINELAKKSKSPQGLTPAEEEERARLRKEFIDDFRRNLVGALENVDIVEADGSITHVKDIPARKRKAEEENHDKD